MLTTKNKQLLLIKDSHNRLSILGKADSEVPDPSWLAIQRKPFAKDAIFHKAYLLSGGAALIDINDIEVIRKVTQKDINSTTTDSGSFNPAAEKILKLWESPPQLPDFIIAQINK
jgi:hypothetical protein